MFSIGLLKFHKPVYDCKHCFKKSIDPSYA